MNAEDSAEVLSAMREFRAARIIELLDADDAADLVSELDEEDKVRLLARINPELAFTLRKLLRYDPNTAGGVMNPEVAILRSSWTLQEALEHVLLAAENVSRHEGEEDVERGAHDDDEHNGDDAEEVRILDVGGQAAADEAVVIQVDALDHTGEAALDEGLADHHDLGQEGQEGDDPDGQGHGEPFPAGENGFLFGDIQDGNVFFSDCRLDRGDIGIGNLLDFGCTRPLIDGNQTEEITDRQVFSTIGFIPPEILDPEKNNGTLRLTRAADIYSVGCLMLRCVLSSASIRCLGASPVADNEAIDEEAASRLGCTENIRNLLNSILQKAQHPQPQILLNSRRFLLKWQREKPSMWLWRYPAMPLSFREYMVAALM